MVNNFRTLVGSGRANQHSYQHIMHRMQLDLHDALEICASAGTPLSKLLAIQIQKDAAGTLQKLRGIMPTQITVNDESDFGLALAEVAVRMRTIDGHDEQTANTIEAVIDAQTVDVVDKSSEPEEASGAGLPDQPVLFEVVEDEQPLYQPRKKRGRPPKRSTAKRK